MTRRAREVRLLGGAAIALAAALGLYAYQSNASQGATEPPAVGVAADARPAKAGDVWGADYFPNVELVTHHGERVRFFDDLIADKVVAINFIYTHCPDACPMETARLQEVHSLLRDRVGKDVFFYSISIDPANDTPDVLREYVEKWGIGEGWTFLTGAEADITDLRKKLGLYMEEIQSEDSNDHNLSLILGNQRTGRWMKRSPYENPHILATQLGSWLHNWKQASATKREYADAPELRQMSSGESLFRTRCASCHTVGGGEVRMLGERRAGPDLLHVGARRDRAWLARWLAAPDAMIAERDPIALGLLEEFGGLPMPNLRLQDRDIDALLEYLAEESERVSPTADAREPSAERHSAATSPGAAAQS